MKKKLLALLITLSLSITMMPSLALASTNNQILVSLLPKTEMEAGKPIAGDCVNNTFLDMDKVTKAEIVAKVKSLKANTDYKTAENIFKFVNNHMTYEFFWYGIGQAWRDGKGNCQTYADLTGTMLYYAGIPNAYAYYDGHVFNLALCDGKWIDIDSQGMFDAGINKIPTIKYIDFTYKHCIYKIDSTGGPNLKHVGEYFKFNDYAGSRTVEFDKEILTNGVTFPSWMKSYYTSWHDSYPKVPIKGKKDTSAEKMAKEMKYSIQYSGDNFTAKSRLHELKIANLRSDNGIVYVEYPRYLHDDNALISSIYSDTLPSETKTQLVDGTSIRIDIQANSGYELKELKVVSGSIDIGDNIGTSKYAKFNATTSTKDTVIKAIFKEQKSDDPEDEDEDKVDGDSKNKDEINDEAHGAKQLRTPTPTIKGGKNLTIKYKKVPHAKGYQIQYKKGSKVKSKYFRSPKSATRTIKGLKRGIYYIRMRAYGIEEEWTGHSKWTNYKKVRITR